VIAYQRKRGIHLHVMVTEDELNTIRQRMAGISNTRGLYPKDVFKRLYPAIDLSPVRELVSLQRRCAADFN
jgi:hypothetical protein